MSETIGYILISIGVLFDLLGGLGLVRLPDVYNRLQASTKCVTMGTGMILLGVVFITGFNSSGLKAFLAIWFIAITSPTAAHAISRAAHRSGVPLSPGSVVDRYKEYLEESTESGGRK